MKINFKKLFLSSAFATMPVSAILLAASCGNSQLEIVEKDDVSENAVISSRFLESEFSAKIEGVLGIGATTPESVVLDYNNGTIQKKYVLDLVAPSTTNKFSDSSIKIGGLLDSSYEEIIDKYQISEIKNNQKIIYKNLYYTNTKYKIGNYYEKQVLGLGENVSSAESSEIKSKFANLRLDVQTSEGFSINDYYLPSSKVQSKFVVFTTNENDKANNTYMAKYISNKLVTDRDINETTTEANETFSTQRKFKYQTFKLIDGAWVPLLRPDLSLTKDITITWTLPSTISTKFDESIAKQVYVDWELNKGIYVDAIIDSWSDGDTLKFRLADTVTPDHPKWEQFQSDITSGKTEPDDEGRALFKLRIEGMDTPEKNVGGKNSTPFEYQYAELPSQFAKKNFKKGTPIRIFTVGGTGKDSFGRYLGDFFFGEGWKYSYTVELVNSGLTLPLISKDKFLAVTPTDSLYYTIPGIADAFNDAIENKRGFYKNFTNPNGVSTGIYIEKPSNSWDFLWKDSEENLYNQGIYNHLKSKQIQLKEKLTRNNSN
ncbi:hypothetical protein [Mycoplasmopsis iners]|uniref:hypothetical protein n=1 Tax=Mycoplasmopsis iners TaxID=76630 RepID=UPI000495B0CC|nr:hypothetical protein [Mycoplasmopsis iners]